ncbi:MAG: YdeI/OmpD-associated family protein [Dyadobacter fermentans]
MEELLVSKKYQLQRMAGKGGWTFIVISEIRKDIPKKAGLVKVKGRIDDYELMGCNLMSMATGQLFLPVKAEIRKKIKKEAGDWVTVVLYADESALTIPEELIECLRDEPKAWANFQKLAEGAQKEYRDWVYAAKKDETKVSRIAKMIEMLLQGKRLTGDRPS